MTDQPSPVVQHGPPRAGLWKKVLRPDHTVDIEKWRAAGRNAEFVGDCRIGGCGGYLVVDDDPSRYAVPVCFTALCTKCGHEVVAPAGRVLHRSARHGEAPGFYAQRAQMLKKASGS